VTLKNPLQRIKNCDAIPIDAYCPLLPDPKVYETIFSVTLDFLENIKGQENSEY
jgi:hypothetical protein